MTTFSKQDIRKNLERNLNDIVLVNTTFSKAAEEGNIDLIQYLLSSPKIRKKVFPSIGNVILYFSSNSGNLKSFEYIFSSGFKHFVDIHHGNNSFLMNACRNGHVEIVKYILNSPYVKEPSLIKTQSDLPLMWAARNHRFELLKYLLTSSDLKEHSNIHANNNYALNVSVQFKFYDAIQFLLTSSELNGVLSYQDIDLTHVDLPMQYYLQNLIYSKQNVNHKKHIDIIL